MSGLKTRAKGNNTGSVVFSVIFRPLVNSVGFGWTVRIIAFICLAVMLFGLAVLKQRPSPKRPRKLIDWSAFLELRFDAFSASQFFVFAGAYVPFFFLPIFAQEKAGMSESLSLNM